VLEELIKAEEGSSDDERKRDDDDRGRGRMRVGDKIEARYRGRSKYYKGKISRVRADGTFDVAYDDGEAETRVEERLIRSLDGGGRGSRSPSPRGGRRGRLREGAKIEARYRGRSRYYPGRIARDRGDGTFDVEMTTARRRHASSRNT
jgi:hypothetical protein